MTGPAPDPGGKPRRPTPQTRDRQILERLAQIRAGTGTRAEATATARSMAFGRPLPIVRPTTRPAVLGPDQAPVAPAPPAPPGPVNGRAALIAVLGRRAAAAGPAGDVTATLGAVPTTPATREGLRRARELAGQDRTPNEQLADFVRQGARGAAEAGLAVGEGAGKLAAAAGRALERGAEEGGDLQRRTGQALQRLQPTGRTRQQVETLYGDPAGRAGVVGRLLGRLTGDLGLYGTAGLLGRTSGILPRATTLWGEIAQDVLTGAPIDGLIAGAGRTESMAGFLADVAPGARVFPGGPTTEQVAASPTGRVLFEIATGGALAITAQLGLAGMRATMAGSPEVFLPNLRQDMARTMDLLARGADPAEVTLDHALRRTGALTEELVFQVEQLTPALVQRSPDLQRRLGYLGRTVRSARQTLLSRPVAGAAAGAGIGLVVPVDEDTPRAVALAGFGLAGLALFSHGRLGRTGGVGDLGRHFFSRLERRIAEAPFERGTAEQWRALVREGVSQEEVHYTGILEMLEQVPEALRGRSIDKATVLRIATENQLPVEEIVIGRGDPLRSVIPNSEEVVQELVYRHQRLFRRVQGLEEAFNEVAQGGSAKEAFDGLVERITAGQSDSGHVRDWYELLEEDRAREVAGLEDDAAVPRWDDLDPEGQVAAERAYEEEFDTTVVPEDSDPLEGQGQDISDLLAEVEAEVTREGEARRVIEEEGDLEPRWESATEPGGDAYREILLTWDGSGLGRYRRLAAEIGEVSEDFGDLWAAYDGTGAIRGVGWTPGQARTAAGPRELQWSFDAHWDGISNVFVHARVKDRFLLPPDAGAGIGARLRDRERVIYIEELQSDYAQAIRDDGTFDPIILEQMGERLRRLLGPATAGGERTPHPDVRAHQLRLMSLLNIDERFLESRFDDIQRVIRDRQPITMFAGRRVQAVDVEPGAGRPFVVFRVLDGTAEELIQEGATRHAGHPNQIAADADVVFGGGSSGRIGLDAQPLTERAGTIHPPLLPRPLPEWNDFVLDWLAMLRRSGVDLSTRYHGQRAIGGAYPAFPFSTTESSFKLMLRRLLHEAVEEGYDRIAFTNGAQQSRRWNQTLHDNVHRLTWNWAGPTPAARDPERAIILLEATGPSGDRLALGEYKRVEAADLHNVIGRQMADQVREQIRAGTTSGVFTGESLTVGDRGFVELYDEFIPRWLRQIVEKELKVKKPRFETVGFDEMGERRSVMDWRIEDGARTPEAVRERIQGLVGEDPAFRDYLVHGTAFRPSDLGLTAEEQAILAYWPTPEGGTVGARSGPVAWDSVIPQQRVLSHHRYERDAIDAIDATITGHGRAMPTPDQFDHLKEVSNRLQTMIERREAMVQLDLVAGHLEQGDTPEVAFRLAFGNAYTTAEAHRILQTAGFSNTRFVWGETQVAPPPNTSLVIDDAIREAVRTRGLRLGAAEYGLLPSTASGIAGGAAAATTDEEQGPDRSWMRLLTRIGIGVAAGAGLPILVARARRLNERGAVDLLAGHHVPALPERTVEHQAALLRARGDEAAAANLERWMDGSAVRRVVFRGDNKGYRLGDRLIKGRRQSGAGFFFTEDAPMAGEYATGKYDSFNHPESYHEWFEVPVFRNADGSIDRRSRQPTLRNAWHHLSKEEWERLVDTLLRAHIPDEGEGIRFGALGESVIGGPEGWDYYVREARGDWLRAGTAVWLESGAIFDQEHLFGEILKRAGIPFIFTDPRIEAPVVTPVWLAIRRPIDTGNMPADLLMALYEEAKKSRRTGPAVHMEGNTWRPGNFKAWVEVLLEDAADGKALWATSIHPRFVEIAQRLGYDGILDTGGKLGGRQHRIWIAFEPTQVKSAVGNSGAFTSSYSLTDRSTRPAKVVASPGAIANADTQPFETLQLTKPLAAHSEEELLQLERRIRGNQERFNAAREKGGYIGNLDAADYDAGVLARERARRARMAARGQTAAVRPHRGEAGRVDVRALIPAVTTGAGAAVGAATDDDSPLQGAVRGGLTGLVLGAGVSAGLTVAEGRRGLARGGRPVVDLDEERLLGIIDEVRADEARRLGTLPPRSEEAQRALARLTRDVDPDEFVNVAKFALDPSGEDRLRREVTRLVQAGIIPEKQVISNAETVRAARELGLDPEDILDLPPERRLTGAEMLALRNIVSTNITALERVEGRLARSAHPATADDLLTDVERAAMQQTVRAIEAQNEAILSRFTVERSRTGRDLQNMKILAHFSNDPVVWLEKAKRVLGDQPLQDWQRADILELLERGDRQQLIGYIDGLRQATNAEKLATLWKAGLLTAPTTHMANVLGNTTMAAVELVKDVPAFFADRLLRLISGQATKAAPRVRAVMASAEGARRGIREAWDVMRGLPIDQGLRKIDQHFEVNFDNAFLDVYTKSVFRALTAMDRVFFGAAFRRSLDEQARLMVRRNPARTVREWLAAPTDEMVLAAIHDAEVATFTNKGLLGSIAAGAKQRARQGVLEVGGVRVPGQTYAGLLLEGVLPFTQTPANVVARVWDMTPFGLLNTTADLVRWNTHLRASRKLAAELAARRAAGRPTTRVERELGERQRIVAALQKSAAERLGRLAVGAVPMYFGFQWAAEGLLTGMYPTGQRERDQWALEGRQENSLLVPGADGTPRWRSLQRISPVGNLVVFGGHLYQITSDGTLSPGEKVSEAFISMGITATEQTFLRGVKDVIEALSGRRGEGQRFLTNFAASSVPNLIRRIAFALDPVVRDPETVGEEIQARTPFLSRQLPPRIDQLGEEVVRDQSPLAALLDPFSSRTDARTQDPLVAALAAVGAGVTRLRQDSAGGEDDATYRRRLVVWGVVLRQQLEAAIDSPTYQHDLAEVAANLVENVPQFRGRKVADVTRELQREYLEGRVVAVRAALRRVSLAEAEALTGLDRSARVRERLPE